MEMQFEYSYTHSDDNHTHKNIKGSQYTEEIYHMIRTF